MRPAIRSVVLTGPLTFATLAVAAGGAAEAGPTSTQPTAPQPAVTVTDAGDPATAVDLTPGATVGAKTNDTVTTFLTAVASGGGQRVDVSETTTLTYTTEVIAAAPDGGYTQNWAVASATSSEPISESVSDISEFAALTGVLLTSTYDANGFASPVTAAPGVVPTADQAAAIDAQNADGINEVIVVPDSPVGTGATWTVSRNEAAGSIQSTQNYHLVSVADGRYSLEFDFTITYTNTQHPTEPTTLVSGTSTGSGTQTGVVATIGNVWQKFEQVDDLVYTEPGFQADYDITWSTEWVSEPG